MHGFELTVFVIKFVAQANLVAATQFLQRGYVLTYKERISYETEILVTFRRKTGMNLDFHGNLFIKIRTRIIYYKYRAKLYKIRKKMKKSKKKFIILSY